MSNAQRNFREDAAGNNGRQPRVFRIGGKKPSGAGFAAELGVSRARMLFIGISLATSITCFTIYGVRHHLQAQQEKANMIDSITMSLTSQHKISGLGYDDVEQAVDASYSLGLSHKDVLLLLEMKRKIADAPCFFKSKPSIEMIVNTLRLNTEWIDKRGHGTDYATWFGRRAQDYRESGSYGEADRIERILSILSEFNNNAPDEFKDKIIGNAMTETN